MANLTIACPHCGESLEAPVEMAGEVVECPSCQGSMTLPDADHFTEAPAAAGAPAEAEAPADACPSCGAAMQPGAVLCMECGFHLKLGRKIDTDFG